MAQELYCPNCGSVAKPTSHTKGSFAIEVILWLCFIIPGIIYSLWRLSSRERTTCPTCRAPNMIPLDSPRAREAIAKSGPGPASARSGAGEVALPRRPSTAAEIGAGRLLAAVFNPAPTFRRGSVAQKAVVCIVYIGAALYVLKRALAP